MDPHERIPAPLIAAHAGSLRTLVLALARDRHEADEIEQETWLRALTAPPTSFERFGGWLATVARGFASKRRRSQRRRESHEHAYAAERELAGAADASRADTLRAVVEALLALDEPYRSTVWQRYFEGLPPREIASRVGAPLATVESRLNRAHAKLRADLERRLGTHERGTNRALLALIGFEPAWRTALGGALTGACIVGLKSKIVVAAAALWIVWWSWRSFESSTPAAASAERAPAAMTTADAPIAPPAPVDAERRAAIGPTTTQARETREPTANGTAPFEFELDVAPLDAHQRPLAAADVYLAPLGRPFARLGTTDWTGHLNVRWRAHAPRFEGLLWVTREGFGSTPIRRVRLAAGGTNAFVLAMSPPTTTHTELRVTGLVLRNGAENGSLRLAYTTADLDTVDWQFDEQRNAWMHDEWITPNPPWPQPTRDEAAPEFAEIELLGDLQYAFEVSGFDVRSTIDFGTALPVDVWVFGSDGAPIANALVSIAASNSFRGDSTTDAEGHVQNHVMAPGTEPIELLIGAGGGALPLATQRITAKPGEPVSCRLTLFAERSLAGRLVNSDDAPLANWTLELQDARTQDCVGLATTDAAGAFRFGGAPIAPLDVIACDPASGTQFVALAGILPSELDTALVARIDPRAARIRFELVDGAGEPIRDAEVRALATFGARGDFGARGVRVDLPEDDPRAVWQTAALAPGEYELEVGAKARGSRVLGRFRVEPGETLDLGALRWVSPEFSLRSKDAASTGLWGRYATLDQGIGVWSRDFRGALPFTVPLADGVWQLQALVAPLADVATIDDAAELARERPVSLEPGRERELVLDARAAKSGGNASSDAPGERSGELSGERSGEQR
ncbi:MAG: sigma-70 family RNA polymerase sigma factor [Planctomycetes bacterium]|nr:sigma-70 family RNA polymerase sigma factor [Planctomycetota bacterium]